MSVNNVIHRIGFGVKQWLIVGKWLLCSNTEVLCSSEEYKCSDIEI